MISILLENGAGVNAVRNDGTTALMGASSHGHTVVVPILLQNEADVNAKANYGDDNTALIKAIMTGQTEIVELLEKAIKAEQIEQISRDNKQKTMELVTSRNEKLPSLRLLSYSQLPTEITRNINENKMFHPEKFGGKRKTSKSNKSKKNQSKKNNTNIIY